MKSAINNYPSPSPISLSIGRKSFMVPEYVKVELSEQQKSQGITGTSSEYASMMLMVGIGVLVAGVTAYMIMKESKKKKKKRSKSLKTK